MENCGFKIFGDQKFVDLNLYQSGFEQCPSLYMFGPAKRNHFLFHYIISGKGRLIAIGSDQKEREFDLSAGQGFMIHPQQITTYIADKEDPWMYTWFEFDGMVAKECVLFSGLTPNKPVYIPKDPKEGQKIKELIMSLSSKPDSSIYELIGKAYLILNYINRSSSSQGVPKAGRMVDFYLQEIFSYVNQHYNQELTVEEMADHLKISRTYLNRIFKDNIGKSPKEFLTNFRMTKAYELLRKTDLSIGEIGQAVGYPNLLHFSRAFKNFYGLSPKNWRDQFKMDEITGESS